MKKIAFHTHANNKTGFGHLARCFNLSRILLAKDKKLEIYFIGNFNNNIKLWINSHINIKFGIPKKNIWQFMIEWITQKILRI